MTTIETTTQSIVGIEEFQPLASCTLALLDRAARQAYAFEATEVGPEHLLLAAIASDDEEGATTLTQLGMDRQVLRAQVRAIFQAQHEMDMAAMTAMTPMPFSHAAHECVRWATEQAAAQYQQELLPVHILLGSLRCSHSQPLLVLLLSGVDTILPTYVSEETNAGYTRAIDQLIRARIRTQRILPTSTGHTRRMLTSLERPTVTFADILGFQHVKQELREMVDILRKPRLYQSNRLVSVYGMLLVGTPGNNRAMLARALAGEAVVPLVCLSMPSLVEMVSASASEEHEALGELDVDLNNEAYERVRRQNMVQKGREVLSSVFEQARQTAPSILLIDDLDALTRVEREVCIHWQKQLIAELDARDYHPAMVVIATTHRPDHLNSALLLPGRFERRIVLDGTITKPFARDQRLCPACQHEVPPRWNYCGYCGGALARTCASCGNRLPDMLGLRFCPECGAVIEA